MASIGEYFFNDLNKNVPENMDPFSSETASTYSNIISLYIPYFNQLPGELKKVFLNRTHHFKTLKNFHYVGMEEQAEIPILISAAAVQLTLGLINYELPFFKNIYVTPDVYQTPEASELFVGHVAPSGIYLSWKYFLQGYADDTDNVNVAIHEWRMP